LRPGRYFGHRGSKIEPRAEPISVTGIHTKRFRAAARYKKEQPMVRKALEITLIAGTLLLAACNTVAGAGKDVSSAGKAVSNAADGAK
jgi:predicted small secreted protein